MSAVGFLHTAHSHEQLFENIIREQFPDIESCHLACPDLLVDAQRDGITESLLNRLNGALLDLVDQGAGAVSCTCSTLGDVVENRVINGVRIQRIDRAAADQVVRYQRVLVLAAIESAAEAAERLLESAVGSDSCHWLVVLVPGAWSLFQAGDLEAYDKQVAEFADSLGQDYDAVFFSQASMQGAARLCRHPEVITTPLSGVSSLVQAIR